MHSQGGWIKRPKIQRPADTHEHRRDPMVRSSLNRTTASRTSSRKGRSAMAAGLCGFGEERSPPLRNVPVHMLSPHRRLQAGGGACRRGAEPRARAGSTAGAACEAKHPPTQVT